MTAANLMGGTEAIYLLGLNPKRVDAESVLKNHGIKIVFSRRAGRGKMVLVKREDVMSLIASKDREHHEKLSSATDRQIEFIKSGEKTRFVPTVEALEVLKRIETKIDRILAIWGES